MKFTMALCLLLIMGAIPAIGDELPALTLSEGANEIAVSVVNRSAGDLDGVTVTAAADLPGWLTVVMLQQTMDVAAGAKGADRFAITFTVSDDAPADAFVEIPLSFVTDDGRKWDYSVTAQVENTHPESYALFENYPNPFNPSTTISYALKESAHTTLIVYNAMGQKVRTLTDSHMPAGRHEATWNGRDESGNSVSSGVYFYTLTAGDYTKTMKMLFVQ
ncbi:hypothetical protein ES708_35032 [subsurface metagenome]